MVKYYTGPRGGKYYRKGGRKVYVSNNKKQKSKSISRCRKSKKYERCVRSVKRQNKKSRKGSYNPWAVCTASVCK